GPGGATGKALQGKGPGPPPESVARGRVGNQTLVPGTVVAGDADADAALSGQGADPAALIRDDAGGGDSGTGGQSGIGWPGPEVRSSGRCGGNSSPGTAGDD